jgi:hypothetical protein
MAKPMNAGETDKGRRWRWAGGALLILIFFFLYCLDKVARQTASCSSTGSISMPRGSRI